MKVKFEFFVFRKSSLKPTTHNLAGPVHIRHIMGSLSRSHSQIKVCAGRQAGRMPLKSGIFTSEHIPLSRETEEAKRASHLLVPTSIGRCAFVKYSELQLSLARITPCARGLPGAHPPILFTDRSWVISALMTYVPSRPRPPRRAGKRIRQIR